MLILYRLYLHVFVIPSGIWWSLGKENTVWEVSMAQLAVAGNDRIPPYGRWCFALWWRSRRWRCLSARCRCSWPAWPLLRHTRYHNNFFKLFIIRISTYYFLSVYEDLHAKWRNVESVRLLFAHSFFVLNNVLNKRRWILLLITKLRLSSIAAGALTYNYCALDVDSNHVERVRAQHLVESKICFEGHMMTLMYIWPLSHVYWLIKK